MHFFDLFLYIFSILDKILELKGWIVLDFKILEYMIAIAETGSVTKAAKRLYISQSGLNQQLIKTETDLGTPLFYRSKKEMRPTPAGKIYIDNARKILQIAKNCVTQIYDLSEDPQGTITYGQPFEHGADLFLQISREFSSQFPHVSVTLMEQTVREMQDKIAANQMDLAFVMMKNPPSSQFNYVKLVTERLVLGVPIKHPAAADTTPNTPLHTIDLRLFKNDKFAFMFAGSTMRAVIDPLFEKAGFVPNIRYETHMNNLLYRLVRQGLCCTIIPQSYARRNSHCAWFLLEGDPSWEWYIIYSKFRTLSAADRYLIELSQKYAQQMKDYWQIHGIGSPVV
ncbi:MAG: LysR family transcriptional regulator [Clostridiales bacterium]|nr:LysR family transcriptional regulator [Clostridiales bacterium]